MKPESLTLRATRQGLCDVTHLRNLKRSNSETANRMVAAKGCRRNGEMLLKGYKLAVLRGRSSRVWHTAWPWQFLTGYYLPESCWEQIINIITKHTHTKGSWVGSPLCVCVMEVLTHFIVEIILRAMCVPNHQAAHLELRRCYMPITPLQSWEGERGALISKLVVKTTWCEIALTSLSDKFKGTAHLTGVCCLELQVKEILNFNSRLVKLK